MLKIIRTIDYIEMENKLIITTINKQKIDSTKDDMMMKDQKKNLGNGIRDQLDATTVVNLTIVKGSVDTTIESSAMCATD